MRLMVGIEIIESGMAVDFQETTHKTNSRTSVLKSECKIRAANTKNKFSYKNDSKMLMIWHTMILMI